MSATHEDSLTGAGGLRIFWQSWLPAGAPRAAVVIAHGFGEHGGRYAHVATRLADDGYAVYVPDHRGHGRSEGPRARIVFADAAADLDQLMVLIGERHPGIAVFLLGHSMGGAIALRYCMKHQERLAGLILSGALAEIEGRAAVQAVGKVIGALAPNLPMAKIDPALISRDPAVVNSYVADPLVYHKPVPAGTVAEFVRHVQSLPGDVAAIKLPALLMYGTDDKLAAPTGSMMLAQRLGSEDLTTIPYQGLYHEILNEPEQDQVLDQLLSWLDARVPALASS